MTTLTLATKLDALCRTIGKATTWLTLAMVIMMGLNVAMRYLFAAGAPWQQELVRFMHAIVFLLGAAYAYGKGDHVRVDIFYQRFSDATKAWVNIIGICGFLFPLCTALLYFSYDTIIASWGIYEGSNEYHGMPGVFLLKSCIWACAALLITQGIATLLRAWATITAGRP